MNRLKKHDFKKQNSIPDMYNSFKLISRSEMYNKILNNQIISVKLCCKKPSEFDAVEDTSEYEKNCVISDITCFCGRCTKFLKQYYLSARIKYGF